MSRCLTCRIRKKGCPSPWISDSCTSCARLHIPCAGSGHELPSWYKNKTLVTLCRRVLSDQIKYGRKQNRSRMSSQPMSSVEGLVTELLNVLSTRYSFNHVAYGRDFCTITFLDETTRALGILKMESLVQNTTSRLGFVLDTSRDTASISTSEVRPAPHNVQLPIHHLVSHPPFSYAQPNALYTPHSHAGQLPSNDSLANNHSPRISGHNVGLGMAGMSTHVRSVGSEYTTRSFYGSGTMCPTGNPTLVDPTPGQTLDSVATSVPARVRAHTHRFCSRN